MRVRWDAVRFWGQRESILTVVVCLAAVKFGLSVAVQPGAPAFLSPAFGIALALLLGFGIRLWPAVLAGALVGSAWTFACLSPPGEIVAALVAAGLAAAGLTCQAVLAATFIRRFITEPDPFARGTDLLRFVEIVAVCGILGATGNTLARGLTELLPWNRAALGWLTWWLAELAGVLVLTPLLLAVRRGQRTEWHPLRLVEASLFIVVPAGAAVLAFRTPLGDLGGRYPLGVLILPFLLWAAFRFGTAGVAMSLLGVVALITGDVLGGPHVFASGQVEAAQLFLLLFLLVMTLTGLFVAAVLEEHGAADRELRQAHDTLEAKVLERTSQLVRANAALQGEVAERERMTEVLQHRLTMEELVAVISADFLALEHGSFDAGIVTALRKIGEYIKVDRSFVNLLADEQGTFGREYEWCRPGVTSQTGSLRDLTLDKFPWMRSKLSRFETVHVPCTLELPPEAAAERTLWLTLGVKSYLGFPLTRHGRLIGLMGFNSERVDRRWGEEDLRLLRIMGEGFANLLARMEAEEGLYRERGLFMGGRTVVFRWRNAEKWPVEYVSPNVEQQFGYKPEAFVRDGLTFADVLNPGERKQLFQDVWRQLSVGKFCFEREYQLLRSDGAWRWVTDFTVAERENNGQISHFHGYLLDITDRKRVEEELVRERDQAQRYLDTAAVLMVALNPQGQITLINRKGCEILGRPEAELLGRNWFDTCVPEDLRTDLARLFSARMKGESGIADYHETAVLAGDGSRRILIFQNTLLRDDAEQITGILSSGADVTVQKKAEAERRELEIGMQQAQKLESLGVLSSGIAHGFNNLLTGILGHASLAIEAVPAGAPLREIVESIQESARKAAELTRQLLAYSGKGRFLVEPFELSTLVRNMTSLLEVSASRNCVLQFELAKLLPRVRGDVSQFRQVLMNLVTNASEAITGHSGTIVVRTGATECDRAALAAGWVHDPLPPGLYVYVEVEDTGGGMTPEVQARIFDPFFTTKFAGRGLGLAAVLGIVRGHHGTIQLQSQPGQGTRFRVLLPVANLPDDDATARPRDASAWRGNGTILVVDDEETVRVLARRALQALGFEVLTVSDGREALRVFFENGDHLRAVLLDLTMPHMRGDEVCRELRKIRTDVPILLSSGYSETDVTADLAGLEIAGFIQKPYSVDDLREKLRAILDKGAPPVAGG